MRRAAAAAASRQEQDADASPVPHYLSGQPGRFSHTGIGCAGGFSV